MQIQKYELVEEVGNGNFSKVYKAIDNKSGVQFALKVMNSHRGIARKESQLLSKMKHPNIINCFNYEQDEESCKLYLEYLPTNTLSLYEETIYGLKEDQIKCIMFQTALALAYIHRKGIIHRDVKPENILIDKSKAIIKIIDFGLAISEREMMTDYIATRWYRSPENLLCTREYTTAIDVFSLGCVMVQLYLGDPLFPGIDNSDQIAKIFQVLGYPTKEQWPKGYRKLGELDIDIPFQAKGRTSVRTFLSGCDDNLIDLIQKMLILNPNNRIKAQDIVMHDYFSNIQEIVPPIVYQRFQKDYLSQAPTTRISVPELKHNLPNRTERLSRERQRIMHLDKSAHHHHDNNDLDCSTVRFGTGNNVKMNSKFSLREIRMKEVQEISRHFPPVTANNGWGFTLDSGSISGRPMERVMCFQRGQQRDMYGEGTDRFANMQRRPSQTQLGFTPIKMDSSSSPKMLTTLQLERSLQTPLKTIQSTASIRKVSDHLIDKQQKFEIFHQDSSTSEQFARINNLTLIESRHHRQVNPPQQKNQHHSRLSRENGGANDSLFKGFPRNSPSKDVPTGKNLSPNSHYKYYQNSHHFKNFGHSGSYHKQYRSKEKQNIEYGKSLSLVNQNRRTFEGKKKSVNFTHNKGFSNRREIQNTTTLNKDSKTIKITQQKTEGNQRDEKSPQFYIFNVPLAHSVKMYDEFPSKNATVFTPSTANANKKGLNLKQNTFSNNIPVQPHRKTPREQNRFKDFEPTSNFHQKIDKNQQNNINRKHSHHMNWIVTANTVQNSHQGYQQHFQPIAANGVAKDAKSASDHQKESTANGYTFFLGNQGNLTGKNQPQRGPSFGIFSPTSNAHEQATSSKNTFLSKGPQPKPPNNYPSINPRKVQPNLNLSISNNTSPRACNGHSTMISPRAFRGRHA